MNAALYNLLMASFTATALRVCLVPSVRLPQVENSFMPTPLLMQVSFRGQS
jgi:hypothetical protein